MAISLQSWIHICGSVSVHMRAHLHVILSLTNTRTFACISCKECQDSLKTDGSPDSSSSLWTPRTVPRLSSFVFTIKLGPSSIHEIRPILVGEFTPLSWTFAPHAVPPPSCTVTIMHNRSSHSSNNDQISNSQFHFWIGGEIKKGIECIGPAWLFIRMHTISRG